MTMTSVGTRIAGSTLRTSPWYSIFSCALATPAARGLALVGRKGTEDGGIGGLMRSVMLEQNAFAPVRAEEFDLLRWQLARKLWDVVIGPKQACVAVNQYQRRFAPDTSQRTGW